MSTGQARVTEALRAVLRLAAGYIRQNPALALRQATGGPKVMQAAVLVVSFPILVVGVVMSFCLVKHLARDFGS
jgi:choline-glycine betaine transporter